MKTPPLAVANPRAGRPCIAIADRSRVALRLRSMPAASAVTSRTPYFGSLPKYLLRASTNSRSYSRLDRNGAPTTKPDFSCRPPSTCAISVARRLATAINWSCAPLAIALDSSRRLRRASRLALKSARLGRSVVTLKICGCAVYFSAILAPCGDSPVTGASTPASRNNGSAFFNSLPMISLGTSSLPTTLPAIRRLPSAVI